MPLYLHLMNRDLRLRDEDSLGTLHTRIGDFRRKSDHAGICTATGCGERSQDPRRGALGARASRTVHDKRRRSRQCQRRRMRRLRLKTRSRISCENRIWAFIRKEDTPGLDRAFLLRGKDPRLRLRRTPRIDRGGLAVRIVRREAHYAAFGRGLVRRICGAPRRPLAIQRGILSPRLVSGGVLKLTAAGPAASADPPISHCSWGFNGFSGRRKLY
jgi:hypothetical protein